MSARDLFRDQRILMHPQVGAKAAASEAARVTAERQLSEAGEKLAAVAAEKATLEKKLTEVSAEVARCVGL